MAGHIHIPMFPLTLLPLPGELVPLHIFEPRYKELLHDVESEDITFGIYFNHSINIEKIGALMKLESIIKRYPSGESDIIVRCIDIFKLDTLFRTFNARPYPGGDAHLTEEEAMLIPSQGLYDLFSEYMVLRNIKNHFTAFDHYQIANELALDVHERYELLTATVDNKEKFLKGQLRFQLHILKQEEQSKSVFHLN